MNARIMLEYPCSKDSVSEGATGEGPARGTAAAMARRQRVLTRTAKAVAANAVDGALAGWMWLRVVRRDELE